MSQAMTSNTKLLITHHTTPICGFFIYLTIDIWTCTQLTSLKLNLLAPKLILYIPSTRPKVQLVVFCTITWKLDDIFNDFLSVHVRKVTDKITRKMRKSKDITLPPISQWILYHKKDYYLYSRLCLSRLLRTLKWNILQYHATDLNVQTVQSPQKATPALSTPFTTFEIWAIETHWQQQSHLS